VTGSSEHVNVKALVLGDFRNLTTPVTSSIDFVQPIWVRVPGVGTFFVRLELIDEKNGTRVASVDTPRFKSVGL
jgi:hypothetical protein